INRGRLVASGTVPELRDRNSARRLRVTVPDAPDGWAERVGGVRVISADGPDFQLELAESVDPQEVLRAAVATGRVEYFSREISTLVELFRETVAPDHEEVA
ncbi:MAG TPA: DUF4162 domain-containing protein, partial [Mycobacteriales bacterium]|nr:DUF4162 domain-containing protein [Mycobacteriales bacterium]